MIATFATQFPFSESMLILPSYFNLVKFLLVLFYNNFNQFATHGSQTLDIVVPQITPKVVFTSWWHVCHLLS